MPDLPETGLKAVLENAAGFAKDAKAVADAYNGIVAAEQKVAASSPVAAQAMYDAGRAAELAAVGFQKVAQDAANAGAALSSAISPDTQQRLQAIFKTFEDVSPQAGQAIRDLAVGFIDSEESAVSFAETMEEVMSTADFAVGKVTASYSALLNKLSDQDAARRVERVYKAIGTQSKEMEADLRKQGQAWTDAGKDAQEWADSVEKAYGDTVRQIEQGAGQIGGAIDAATGPLEAMVGILSLGVVQQIAGSLSQLGGQILSFSKDTAESAARIEELGLVLDNLAKQNNLSAEALHAQVAAIREQGIQASVAYDLVTQFAKSNLDLAKASQLAQVAMDAAVFSGEDTSQALQGILHGIMTLQPEMLRYRGLIVDLEGEYRKWAETSGKTYSDLTGSEKQMIALNATLAAGAKITGTYKSAMESASKQLRSFPRYIEDLKVEMGESLLPVYSDAIFATKDLIKAISDLDPAWKSTAAAVGVTGGAMAKFGGTAIQVGSQVGMMALSLKQLIPVLNLAKIGLLGFGVAGGALLAVGIVSYLKAQEEAHRQEAVSVLESSESYNTYIMKLDTASLSSYALTQSLYELVKAQEASAQAAFAEGLVDALAGLSDLRDASGFATEGVIKLRAASEGSMDALSDMELIILSDRDAVLALGIEWGKSGEELTEWTNKLVASSIAEISARENARLLAIGISEIGKAYTIVQEQMDKGGLELEKVQIATDGLRRSTDTQTASVRDFAKEVGMSVEDVRKLRYEMGYTESEIKSVAEDMQITGKEMVDLARDTGLTEQEIRRLNQTMGMGEGAIREYAAGLNQIAVAEQRANEEIAAADADSMKQRADLWRDYQSTVNGIQQDIAQVGVDLADDILQAEQDAAQEREQIHRDLAAAIEESERDLAQAIEDLQRDTQRRMADAQRGYEQDMEDARLDLARDMEQIERDHESKMLDLAIDYWEDVVDLARSYNEKLANINRSYADAREALLSEYDLDKGPSLEDQRRAIIDEIRRLEEIQESHEGPEYVTAYLRIGDLRKQLEELKEMELAELDDRKAAELAELEEWLVQEQAKIDEAFALAAAKEQLAFEERKAERAIQYQQQVEDLRLALEREQQEIQIDAERRYQELQAQHERERAEIERRTQEALAQVDTRLAEEKAKLAQAAAERTAELGRQLEEEKQNYADRYAELVTANDERKAEIESSLEEEKESIETGMDNELQAFVDGWADIDPAVATGLQKIIDLSIQPKLDEMVRRTQAAFDAARAIVEAWPQAHSPSPWALKAAESVKQGIEAGMDLGGIQTSFDDFKGGLQTSLSEGWARERGAFEGLLTGALPATRVSAPALPTAPPPAPPTLAAAAPQKAYTVNYTGRPVEEHGIRSLMTMLEMVSGG